MIHLENLHVTFNPGTPLAMPALQGLDLTIPAGQFVTVIGSNGAGKSTLLNVISGDLRPDVGRIHIGDQDVTRWSTPRRAKLVARVFQNPLAGSCPDLTVAENLALADRRGQSRTLGPALTPKLRQTLGERLAGLGLGLERRLNDRMGLLSGGQRQAISLLMATMAPHQILLLDEHTAALDPQTAGEVLGLTRRIVAEHRLTVLMVTHSLRQALELGDRTVMLHQGRVIFDVAGEARSGLSVGDLLERFGRGDAVSDVMLLD
jgi:putative tryptophan/tyrosine transport system ATP-binding protein